MHAHTFYSMCTLLECLFIVVVVVAVAKSISSASKMSRFWTTQLNENSRNSTHTPVQWSQKKYIHIFTTIWKSKHRRRLVLVRCGFLYVLVLCICIHRSYICGHVWRDQFSQKSLNKTKNKLAHSFFFITLRHSPKENLWLPSLNNHSFSNDF